jgi:hypothetical protein
VSTSEPATVATVTAPPVDTESSGVATTASTTPPDTATTTTSTPAALDGTGVRGRVTAGPTCPVERPDEPCPPSPVQGRRVDALDAAGRTAGGATTDEAGDYSILLPPGDYTLRVVIDGPFPQCPETAVTVTPGPPVTTDVECDTGIR